MAQQVAVDPAAVTGSDRADGTRQIASDLAYKRLAMVNVVFVGPPVADDGAWVLIDAALPGTADTIASAAADRFGPTSRPAGIVMTHGHFDHTGALATLAARWDVPVYAHPLELPFLNGTRSYEPPDPTVGGGVLAALSPLYPRGPVDVSRWLRPLPEDGSVPGMPGWRWLHTPGHAPGHVSFWRERDRALIAGDAFITTAQESAYAVATQAPELHGPPMYFTPDWIAAAASVRALSALAPELVVTGHGQAMRGEAMRTALAALARDFERVAVPAGHR
jgi:glyoxylase-like metal-dependent hydrolase (beta-lactamase superfamily II)